MVSTNKVYLNNGLPNSSQDQDDLEKAREYLAKISAEFEAAFELEELLQEDAGDLTKDKAELANIQQSLDALKNKWGLNIDTDLSHYKNADDLNAKIAAAVSEKWPKSWNVPNGVEVLWGNCDIRGDYYSEEQACLEDLYTKQQEVDKAEKELEAIDPEIKDLDSEINALINSLAHQGVDHKFISQDLATLLHYLAPLFKAMKEKLEKDKDEALIKAGGSGALSDADILKLFLDAIRSGFKEQSTLSGLEDQMNNDIDSWRHTENHADEDMKKFNWWSHVRTLGGDIAKEEEVRAIRKNAQRMEGVIRNLIKELGPAIASNSPGFSELSLMLEMLMQEVSDILKSDSTTREKKEKILSLLGMVLSLLTAVQSQVATDRAALDKKVAQAMQNASLISIQDSISQQKQLDILKHEAGVMKKVLFAAKIIAAVVTTWFSAGLLTRFAMLGFSAADLSGGINKESAMDKANNALALEIQKIMNEYKMTSDPDAKYYNSDNGPSDNARIISDVIMGVSQALIFAGTAGFDNITAPAEIVAENAAEAQLKAAEAALEAIVRDTIKKAAIEASAEEIENMVQISLAQMNSLAKKTVGLVQEKLAQLLMKEASPGALFDLVKLSRGTYEPAIKASQASIEETIRESENFVKMGLEGSFSEEVFETQAKEAANRAVANEMHMPEEEVEEATGNVGKNFRTQALWTSAYSLASSNFLLDAITKAMKDSGLKEDDKTFIAIQSLIRAIQTIMAVVGMMMASNAPQSVASALPLWASRIQSGSQVVIGGMNAVAEGSLAMISSRQAQIIPEVAKDKANIEAFQLMLKQLFQNQKSEQNHYSEEEIASYKSSERIIKEGLVNNDDIARILSTAV